MKKIILAALVAVSAISANAQVYMGGSLGIKSEKENYDGAKATTTVTISPEVGYTLNDKWSIGAIINTSIESTNGCSTFDFSIAPYARWTFAKAGIASFFVDGGFIVGTEGEVKEVENKGKTEWKSYDGNTTFGIGFRPGVSIALSDKVSLVGKLGYLGYKYTKYSDDFKNLVGSKGCSEFGLGVDNTNVSLGVYWNF